jgi:hypothetical protein
MQLIRLNYRQDFGHDWYIQIFNVKNYSVLQISLSWNDSSGWPYLQISSGANGLLSILFWIYKFGLDIDLFSRTWNFNYLDKNETQFP